LPGRVRIAFLDSGQNACDVGHRTHLFGM
jgi:hypothetical protein